MKRDALFDILSRGIRVAAASTVARCKQLLSQTWCSAEFASNLPLQVRMQSDRRAVASGALQRPRYTGMANALAVIVRRARARRTSLQVPHAARFRHTPPPVTSSDGRLSALFLSAREEGVRGLWQGTLPAVQRAALVNLGELAAYDTAKQLCLDSGACWRRTSLSRPAYVRPLTGLSRGMCCPWSALVWCASGGEEGSS